MSSIIDLIRNGLFGKSKPKRIFTFDGAPSDDVGRYIEKTGIVVSVDKPSFEYDPRFEAEQISVDVKMDNGVIYKAFTASPPKIGYVATVRHY